MPNRKAGMGGLSAFPKVLQRSVRPVHPTVVDGDEIDVLADAVRAEALDTATRAEMASPESKTEELNNGTNIMIYLL